MQDLPPESPFTGYTHTGQAQGSSPRAAGIGSSSSPSPDDLTRVFNTALLATRVESQRDFATELFRVIETPAFKAILQAVRQLARSEGISEKEAAEALIQTFRKVDRIWGDYLHQEGVDRLKAHFPST